MMAVRRRERLLLDPRSIRCFVLLGYLATLLFSPESVLDQESLPTAEPAYSHASRRRDDDPDIRRQPRSVPRGDFARKAALRLLRAGGRRTANAAPLAGYTLRRTQGLASATVESPLRNASRLKRDLTSPRAPPPLA